MSTDPIFCAVFTQFMVYSGPLHGGANEAVIRMLISIGRYVLTSDMTARANAWTLVLKMSQNSSQL